MSADNIHYLKEALIIGDFLGNEKLLEHMEYHFTTLGYCVDRHRDWLTDDNTISAFVKCANLQRINNSDIVIITYIKGVYLSDSTSMLISYAREKHKLHEIIDAIYDPVKDKIEFVRNSYIHTVVNNYLHDNLITNISGE